MAIAGTLAVNILAKTDKFQRGMSKAKKSMGGFRNSVKSAALSMGGMVAGLASIAGIRGLGRMTAEVINSSDRINKLSTQVGISTERLSLMVHQADLAGVSQEQLATSIKKMERSISDGNEGLTTQLRAFKRLGIEVKDLIDIDPAVAFSRISNAMGQMENPTLRAATAMEIFGRAGAEMIPFFEQDNEKIAREFNRINAALKQIDADNLSQVKDRLSDIGLEFKVLRRDVVSEFGPAMIDATRGILGISKAFRDLQGQRVQRMEPIIGPGGELEGFKSFGPQGPLGKKKFARRPVLERNSEGRVTSQGPLETGIVSMAEVEKRLDQLSMDINRQTKVIQSTSKTTSF